MIDPSSSMSQIQHNNTFKQLFKKRFPAATRVYRQLRSYWTGRRWFGRCPQQVFTHIYHENIWNNRESLSGIGSSHRQTRTIQQQIPILLESLRAESLL